LIGKPLFPFSFRAIDIYRPAIFATLLFELVNAYEIYFVRRLNKFLNQSDISPLEKLQNFVNDAGEKLQKYDFKRGCILGNLGQEVSYLAPEIIARIESIFQVWEK
jgi:TetR/AcrR family transcriptional repressor of nem operon